jgi:hypothetical protein
VAITGPGTAFDPARQWRLHDLPPNLILLVDVADSGVHWAEPGGDISVDHVPPTIASGVYGRGVHVGFADGFIGYLRPDTPVEDLKKFFTIEGARTYDRNVVLRPYLIGKWTGYPTRN